MTNRIITISREFEKLRAIKQSGRPDKLSDEQKAEIKKVLRESPDKHGYCVWDGISLSDYITSKYDIKYSIRQCRTHLDAFLRHSELLRRGQEQSPREVFAGKCRE